MFTNNQKPYFRSEHTKYQPRIYVKKTTKQVKSFNYLGNMISYESELDIEKKNNYLKITGILNNVFRPQKALKKQE
jgi:hypothetical protein